MGPNRSIFNRTRARLLALASSILLLIPADLWARAGGGQHYSGGGGGGGSGGGGFGGGSGGHGSGDGGGGAILWFLVRLIIIDHPAVGIPLIILVGVGYYFYQKGNAASSSVPSSIRRAPAEPTSHLAQGIAILQQRDPSFNPAEFLNRVRTAFVKIQDAWCSQDLKAVRPFISDGVHERFLLQFDEQKFFVYRNQLDNLQINDVSIVQIQSHNFFDEISVRIAASAADYDVSLRDGKRVGGSRSQESFAEVWSFLRRSGAVTKAGASGLIEGNCPNCGAAIEMNQSANCTHCKALLRSGEYDWVLVEITQESEWQLSQQDEIPGVTQLRQVDPDFNVLALEDLASVMFWRREASKRLAKIAPLKKIASENFSSALEERLKAEAAQPQRIFFAESAIGSVQTLGIIAGEKTDKALVEIRWSGTRFTIDQAKAVKNTHQNALGRLLLVLGRKHSTKTEIDKSVSSAHCPTCGAPESGGTTGACEFCGQTLNDGSKNWVLIGAPDAASDQGQTLLRELYQASPPASDEGPIPLAT